MDCIIRYYDNTGAVIRTVRLTLKTPAEVEVLIAGRPDEAVRVTVDLAV